MIVTAFALFALVMAHDYVYPGYLFISSLDDESIYERIGVENENVGVSRKQRFFRYHSEGSVTDTNTGRFLSFNNSGKLILTTDRDRNFNVSRFKEGSSTRNFTYGGSTTFELCGDNLIGHMSKCDGARRISITYKDFVRPR